MFGVVMVAAASLMLLRDNDSVPCERATTLKITATPAIAPAIQEITKRDIDLGCVEVRVVAQGAPDAATAIAAGTGELPALWIPDSAIWARRAAQQAAGSGVDPPSLDEREPLATSPLVVVTARTHGARLGWPDDPVGWQALVTGTVPTTIGDPLATTEGLATLQLVRGLLGNPDGTPRPELVGAMLRVGRDTAPSIRAAYDRLSSAGEPLAFTATEQSVIAHNRGGDTAAVAVYPREGTIALEYPLVRVTPPEQPAELTEAVEHVERALRTPEALKTLQAAGFRSPDGELAKTINASAGVTTGRPALLPPPPPEQATEVLRTWSAVTLDARMLVVIDVSGSMDASAGNGQTRIELARDASLTALALFPDTSVIGLWAFSVGQAPPADWVQLVPIGPLSEQLGGGTRRQAMQTAAQALPGRTDGGTALNDTVLAAFRAVRDGYDPGKVNSVVLLTDGRDEDADGIDTATLLQTLRAERDPATPVPIITVGMGPEVDFEALEEISAATGGKAYLTRDPADIRGVFLDALLQRQCRPNC
jgi:Ca-activated chloride channel homolog